MTMRAWLRSRRGATAVEYLVMLILTALVVLAAIKVFGGTVKSKYSRANDDLGDTLAAEDRQGRGGEGGDALGPTAQYGVQTPGSGEGGRESAQSPSGAASGSDKAAAGSAQAFGEGSSADGKQGGGSGKDDGDGRIGDADDERAQNRGLADRPDAGNSEGKKSSINPIVILVALLLLGLLLYVMASGKEG